MLDAIDDQTVDERAELTFTATATDPDVPANTLTFSLLGAPEGASIDAGTGAFTWTPTEVQGPDTYTFDVQVCDNGDTPLCDRDEVTVTVNEVNLAPVLAAIGDKAVDEGQPLSFTATATDADVPANALTFSLDGAPSGVPSAAQVVVLLDSPEAQWPNAYPLREVYDGVSPPCATRRRHRRRWTSPWRRYLGGYRCGLRDARRGAAGDVLTYTARVHNAGPDAAANVRVQLTLPRARRIEAPCDGWVFQQRATC